MLNTVQILGRFTKDPEIRYTQTQVPVASFSLAVDRDYTKEGEEKQTDFIDCVAWKKTAEFVGKYFKKGTKAAVYGRLETRTWEKDGAKRKAVEVNVEKIYFAESKREEAPQETKAEMNYDLNEPEAGLPF